MGPLGFSIDQLMELAGLSVASALTSEYPPTTHPRALVLAGPGNNGGDGLVAARHLHHFGYRVSVCYPRPTDRPLYHSLVTQCTALRIPFIQVEDVVQTPLEETADIVVDALFGFSFKGPPRPPFDALLHHMTASTSSSTTSTGSTRIVAVDVPSGWDVEQGDVANSGLLPSMLVSLTAPKLCARFFTGDHHYLGGRFVPPEIIEKYGLNLPPYPGSSQCVRLGGSGRSSTTSQLSVADMRVSYSEKVGELDESRVPSNPWSLFDAWFAAAKASNTLREPNAMALATATATITLCRPSLRFVLMKGYGPRGITFYTNYNSRKGRELEQNPHAAVTFWWDTLERQIRFEGSVTKVPPEESDAYWMSRPWGHQVGGYASQQSSVVGGGRRELEGRQAEAEAAHPEGGGAVPRPPHWGGYVLRPRVVEFWAGRQGRLHDRLRYTLVSQQEREEEEGGTEWEIERLAP